MPKKKSSNQRAAKERAAVERAAEEADLLVRKVQKLAKLLRLADGCPELRPLFELKSFARIGAHVVYFGSIPTTFHLFRSAADAARDRYGALGALVSVERPPSKEVDHVWDVRGLVDLALVGAHGKLRRWSGWTGSQPSSPRARFNDSFSLQRMMQPPGWEHLEQLQ